MNTNGRASHGPSAGHARVGEGKTRQDRDRDVIGKGQARPVAVTSLARDCRRGGTCVPDHGDNVCSHSAENAWHLDRRGASVFSQIP